MTESELLEALETGTLEPGSFRHTDHIQATWALLRKYPLVEVMARVKSALSSLAKRAGAPEKYHETITATLVLLIHQRMLSSPQESWSQFERANPDLFNWNGGALLAPYYTRETLDSDLARIAFILPESTDFSTPRVQEIVE